MPSIQSIRERMEVTETPQRKGLATQLEVLVYDNGVSMINGRMIGADDDGRPSWLAMAHILVMHLEELRKQFNARQNEPPAIEVNVGNLDDAARGFGINNPEE